MLTALCLFLQRVIGTSNYAPRMLLRKVVVVGGDDYCFPLFAYFRKPAHDLLGCGAVKIGGWLVDQ